MSRNDEFDTGYRGHHQVSEDWGAPLHDLTGGGTIYPEDVYSDKGPHIYGGYSEIGRADVKLAQTYRGKPDHPVNIYRAVPKGVKDINPGDWVAINRDYAKWHGESNLGNKFTILKKTVPAKHIINPGDSPSEWGYFPGKQ